MDKWDDVFMGLPAPPTPPNFTPPSSPDSLDDAANRSYYPAFTSRGQRLWQLQVSPSDIAWRAMNHLQNNYLFGDFHMELPIWDIKEMHTADVFGDSNGRNIHVHYRGNTGEYTCCHLALTPTGRMECFCDRHWRHMCPHKQIALFALNQAQIHYVVDRTLDSLHNRDHETDLSVQLLKHKFFGCHARFDAREHSAHVIDDRDGNTVTVDTWSDYFNCANEECIALCTSLDCEHVKKVALAASTMGIFKKNIQNVLTAFRYHKRIRFVEEEHKVFVFPPRRIAFDLDMDPAVMLTYDKGILRCTGYDCQRSMAMCRHLKTAIEYMLLMDSDKFHGIAGDTSRFWDHYKSNVGNTTCNDIISLDEFKELFF